jgi:hypothetical protein
MGPLNIYTNIQNDPCYMIENVLFDVESRLKRCEPDTKGSHSLSALFISNNVMMFRIP